MLCDICDQPIHGKAFEVHFIHREAVHHENGSARIVHRDGTTMTFLCDRCGRWVREAMEHLRGGYRDTAKYVQRRRPRGRTRPSRTEHEGS